MYFQGTPAGALQLLDGDRIAVLAALLMRDILQKLPSDLPSPSVSPAILVEAFITALAVCRQMDGHYESSLSAYHMLNNLGSCGF